MVMARIIYTKEAKSFNEQIALLRSRGVEITDAKKAKEYLSDIGYYRLGFYSFPFEITYPSTGRSRQHNVKPGTRIEDIVALYYFDFDLRAILSRYLSRVEVSIRTTIIYILSMKYKPNNTWFVNSSVVSSGFINSFDSKVYSFIKTKPTIVRHHNKYLGKYAPAWKVIEYMTMGNLEVLYNSLLLNSDKRLISEAYGEYAISSFKNYLSVIREVRNACAHGNVVYGLRLENSITTGVACPSLTTKESYSLSGALRVVDYMLRQVSVNRAADMRRELRKAVARLYCKVPSLRPLIEEEIGIRLPLITRAGVRICRVFKV